MPNATLARQAFLLLLCFNKSKRHGARTPGGPWRSWVFLPARYVRREFGQAHRKYPGCPREGYSHTDGRWLSDRCRRGCCEAGWHCRSRYRQAVHPKAMDGKSGRSPRCKPRRPPRTTFSRRWRKRVVKCSLAVANGGVIGRGARDQLAETLGAATPRRTAPPACRMNQSRPRYPD